MIPDVTTAAQGFLSTLGVLTVLLVVGREAVLYLIDAYYDTKERVSSREARLGDELRRAE